IRVNGRPQRELSLSLFHGAALASGTLGSGKTDWLVSGRRGNLDLILDLARTGIGRPSYLDAFGRVTHRFTDDLSLAANALLLEDDIRLNDSDLEELAQARYRDRYAWLTLDYAPTNSLATRMMLSRTQLESHRRGSADQPGIGRGSLEDFRAHGITAFSLDARWRWSDAAALMLGGEWQQVHGDYRYRHDAQFDLLFEGAGAADSTEQSRQARVTPRGNLFGMYSSLRLELQPPFIVDIGLRWDESTLPVRNDSKLSPRVSLLYQLDDRTRLRAAWGRHAQMQDIDELQVPDGVVTFFAAQQAEHWVVSVERALAVEQTLRIELYRKNYRKLRPRFENLLNTTALLPELKPDRIRIAPDGATAEGAELSLRRTRSGPVQWWASYTWSRVHDRLGGANVSRSWDQRHALSAGLSWGNDRWQTSAAATYHSGWPVPTARLTSDEPPVALLERGGTRLKDYLDIDLRVAREYRFDPASSLTVFFELSNAIDRHNECCIEYEFEDEDGERFLELERIRALPLLPTLGFTLRF
ncbi:MAG: TonB-dependent receptor plug domain-containing protein, partial [Steroidobacteraceae bacterium]